MNPDRKISKSSNKQRNIEHILNAVKAILVNFPIGSSIASLLTDYIPSQREKRILEFTETVSKDLKRLENEINEDYIRNDKFAFIIEKCFKGAAENYQKEKIEAFRAILVNSLIDTSTSQTVKEYYLNLVNNLTVLHIQLLSFFASPLKFLNANGIDESKIQGGLGSFLPIVLPNANLALIKLAFNDLYRFGFTNTDGSSFNTMTVKSGLELLGDRMTKDGRAFIKFISIND